jgi:GxxExxY protein
MANTHVHDPQTYAIIGAGHEVVRNLGTGFSEAVICEALMIEFGLRSIPFKTQVPFPVHYKGHRLTHHFRADLVCFDSVIVEVKVSTRSFEAVQAQILNYLKASGLRCALLLDFSGSSMKAHRFSPNDEWQAPHAAGKEPPQSDPETGFSL